MNRLRIHLHPGVSDRLWSRLESLGVAMLVADAQGQAQMLTGGGVLEKLIVASPLFQASLREHWSTLQEPRPQAVSLWPGLWLVPLPSQGHRRLPGGRGHQRLTAALLLGSECPASEQFHHACDHAHLDHQAVLATCEPTMFVRPLEAQRLAATLAWMQQDVVEIDRRSGELQTLSQQLGESYEELSLLYKFSACMSVDQPPETFLTWGCRELRETVGLRWMALLLIEDEPRLNDLSDRIFTAGTDPCDPITLRRLGRLLMQRYPGEAGVDGPVIVDDTAALQLPILHRIARDLLLVPLVRDGKTLGLLFGGDKLDGTHLTSVDSKLCHALAHSLAMFLENVMLYEDMHLLSMGTLHALTATIDAKDPYTHGHSERVALLSRQLATAAGLDEQKIERIHLAGLVHDIGKIGVPEAVLCKPGKLSREEFELIKKHPEIGKRILQDIPQMHDLIPGVLYHHERWDGQGYPHGLAKKEIPLPGRLICLADSFDAMSSTRTYRRSMSHQTVMQEIQRCAGVQFDPDLARFFVSLDFTPYFQMVERHQPAEASA